jgi:hypothetical protein
MSWNPIHPALPVGLVNFGENVGHFPAGCQLGYIVAVLELSHVAAKTRCDSPDDGFPQEYSGICNL